MSERESAIKARGSSDIGTMNLMVMPKVRGEKFWRDVWEVKLRVGWSYYDNGEALEEKIQKVDSWKGDGRSVQHATEKMSVEVTIQIGKKSFEI